MKIVKPFIFAIAMATVLGAQESKPEAARTEPTQQKRIFQIKYADARDVANVLSVFGYGIRPNPDLHVVAVSAPADAMTAIEDAIKRLDVPSSAAKDIDLTVYLVVASEQPASVASAPLPADIQPVANEISKIFPYKNFRLLDSLLLRTQPGRKATTSAVAAERTPYSFTATPTSVTEDPKGRLIRLDNLNLSMRVPGGENTAISTEITVREGQRVVVGKSSMGADQALILVVTAKIAE